MKSDSIPHLPLQDSGYSTETSPGHQRSRSSFWGGILTGKVLFISILVHIIGGLIATYFVVQRTEARRKVTFQGAPATPSQSQRALEHKVSVARKHKTMSAPAQPKRIASTGLA